MELAYCFVLESNVDWVKSRYKLERMLQLRNQFSTVCHPIYNLITLLSENAAQEVSIALCAVVQMRHLAGAL
jgi:hypothetical protein